MIEDGFSFSLRQTGEYFSILIHMYTSDTKYTSDMIRIKLTLTSFDTSY